MSVAVAAAAGWPRGGPACERTVSLQPRAENPCIQGLHFYISFKTMQKLGFITKRDKNTLICVDAHTCREAYRYTSPVKRDRVFFHKVLFQVLGETLQQQTV